LAASAGFDSAGLAASAGFAGACVAGGDAAGAQATTISSAQSSALHSRENCHPDINRTSGGSSGPAVLAVIAAS
jgi:hypothetical protein